MEELKKFIASNPDPRELKRALAVQMTLTGYTHAAIMKILQVSSGFISKWKQLYIEKGVSGLKLGYLGSKGYLNPEEKQEVLEWLSTKNYWNLNELEYYILEKFGVGFAAKSSYYDLFHEAGISWKKTQKKNPQKNEELVAEKKKEIEKLIKENQAEIKSGEIEVLFVDECHLHWGDICGYVWGKKDIRVEIPISNEKQKQTYYGALSLATGQVKVKNYQQGNTENTIAFIEALREEYSGSQIIIIWDGASYHRSEQFRDYLKEINHQKPESEWLIKCIRLAPNAPEQNPIEYVWLQGKRILREYWYFCQNFEIIKWLFEWSLNRDLFDFPKLSMYGTIS